MQPIFRTAAPNPALRSWVRHYQIIGLNFRGLGAPPAKAYWPRPASALAFYPRDPETVAVPTARTPSPSPGRCSSARRPASNTAAAVRTSSSSRSSSCRAPSIA